MLKLENSEYDLNTLFSFDVLKEILLKLAKSQIKLENEINDLKNKIENKENELQSAEEEEENYYNNNITNQNINNIYTGNNQETNKEDNNNDIIENNIDKENSTNPINQNEDKGNKEINNNDNNYILDKEINNTDNINIQNKEINNIETKKDENENPESNLDNTKDKKEIGNKFDDKISEEKNNIIKKIDIPETHIKNIEKEIKEIQNTSEKMSIPSSQSRTKNPYKEMKITSINSNIPSSGVSPDVITKIMKQLKSLQSKIAEMNKSFNSELNSIKYFNTNYSNFDAQLSLLNDKINSLLEKNTENDKKIEDLQVKMASFNVFSMFKDNGDGTINTTKILVKSLEDKIFKKFELIDERYKVDSLDNIKLKNNMENILPKISQFSLQIEKINDNENKYKEELSNIKKENLENNKEIKNMLNNDINNSIEIIKNNIEQNIENRISNLEKELNELKSNNGDNYDILKLGFRNNEINQDTIDSLDKKITDIRKKMHDINNTLKLHISNNETDLLKNELKDIKIVLDKKITKDDLKELYNYHMNTSDEINDLKDQISLTFDDIRKMAKDINNIQLKIESINGNLSLLQENPKIGNAPIIDFSKYIDQTKLTETLRPLLKEMEKIYKEIDSLRRDLSLVDEENKRNVKNQINKLDEEMNKKINELKTLQKKYLEKIEFHKNIKTLEVQIKSLGEESKKDADSWLLAKRPLKCFNCASCEANIKNDYNSADYLPWKKYPKGEKIHRMGQGFSHMLQMMTSEFVKSIERNELNQDLEINTKNNLGNPNISTNFNEKINFNNNNIIINNKDNNNDFIKNLKKSKMKLPKVHPFSNTKIKKYKLEDVLPVSDDDINYAEENNNNTNNNEDEIKARSPKILKIYKKRGKESFENMGPSTMRNEHVTRNLDLANKFNFMKTDKNIYYKED